MGRKQEHSTVLVLQSKGPATACCVATLNFQLAHIKWPVEYTLVLWPDHEGSIIQRPATADHLTDKHCYRARCQHSGIQTHRAGIVHTRRAAKVDRVSYSVEQRVNHPICLMGAIADPDGQLQASSLRYCPFEGWKSCSTVLRLLAGHRRCCTGKALRTFRCCSPCVQWRKCSAASPPWQCLQAWDVEPRPLFPPRSLAILRALG